MTTYKFSESNKSSLLKIFIKRENLFSFSGDNFNIVDFLDEIWNLRQLQSEDFRFGNAYEDATQHLIHNNDWELDYLFSQRLILLNDNAKYGKFIETIVNPKFRKNENEIQELVQIINSYIESDGYKLIIVDFDEKNLPIYNIREKEDIDSLPEGLKENDIPFYLVKSLPSGDNKQNSDNKLPDSRYFVLIHNSNWNDYNYRTTFHLYFYDTNNNFFDLGETKIIKNDDEIITGDMGDKFTKLSDNYCSLGQTENYYLQLKKLLGKDFESVLFAIKDAALFPSIQEKFERKNKFINSLIRYDINERLLREVKYIISGHDTSNLYSFKYSFKPLYSDNVIEVDFDFDDKSALPNRIYGIIGKNGTGKTQIITSLPINISNKSSSNFSPNIPIFSKVISVSYSIFDRFSLPRKTALFNYVYCGLRNETGDFITEKGLILRFHNTWKKIEEIGRMEKWRKILLTFIEEEIIDEFIVKNDVIFDDNSFKVSLEGFRNVKDKLSSGQGIILYIITEIVANVRLDSLIIYDEPETHLHPNAITQLMNTIYELVNEFESFCIIATHSPLIIRELLSRNVYVIERSGNFSSVRRISIECFGENLSSITDEVFGNKEIEKHSKIILQKLVNEGKSFEEITSLLEFDEVPLSLNAKILIKGLLRIKNEKQ